MAAAQFKCSVDIQTEPGTRLKQPTQQSWAIIHIDHLGCASGGRLPRCTRSGTTPLQRRRRGKLDVMRTECQTCRERNVLESYLHLTYLRSTRQSWKQCNFLLTTTMPRQCIDFQKGGANGIPFRYTVYGSHERSEHAIPE